MTESSWIPFIIFGNSHSNDTSVLSEKILDGIFCGLETQISYEKSGRNALELRVVGTLLSLLSLFFGLSLFNVEVSAHVFASVVGNCLVKSFLGGELNKSHSFGSTGVSVGKEFGLRTLGELVKEFDDIVLGSIVGKSGDSGFEDLVVCLNWNLLRGLFLNL